MMKTIEYSLESNTTRLLERSRKQPPMIKEVESDTEVSAFRLDLKKNKIELKGRVVNFVFAESEMDIVVLCSALLFYDW